MASYGVSSPPPILLQSEKRATLKNLTLSFFVCVHLIECNEKVNREFSFAYFMNLLIICSSSLYPTTISETANPEFIV